MRARQGTKKTTARRAHRVREPLAKTKAKSKTASAKKTSAKTAPAKRTVGTEVALEFLGERSPVWESCSTDPSRPVLLHPWLARMGPPSKRRFFICATDSYQLVRVPVTIAAVGGGKLDDVDDRLLNRPIPVEAVKAWTIPLKKGSYVKPELRLTELEATVQTLGETRTWRRMDAQPVSIAALMKPWDLSGDGLLEEYVIGFNPKMFAKVAKSLGRFPAGKSDETGPVIIRFVRTEGKDGPTGLRPMIVTIDAGGGATSGKVRDLESLGILMPVRIGR